MRARMKHAVELVLWFWFGRRTSEMKQRYAELEASMPDHPKPGKLTL